jgi:hypothetical protein
MRIKYTHSTRMVVTRTHTRTNMTYAKNSGANTFAVAGTKTVFLAKHIPKHGLQKQDGTMRLLSCMLNRLANVCRCLLVCSDERQIMSIVSFRMKCNRVGTHCSLPGSPSSKSHKELPAAKFGTGFMFGCKTYAQ